MKQIATMPTITKKPIPMNEAKLLAIHTNIPERSITPASHKKPITTTVPTPKKKLIVFHLSLFIVLPRFLIIRQLPENICCVMYKVN